VLPQEVVQILGSFRAFIGDSFLLRNFGPSKPGGSENFRFAWLAC
jgi:hypothetical protein